MVAVSTKPKPVSPIPLHRPPTVDIHALDALPADVQVRYVHTRSPLIPGIIVDGKYRVERVMGEGGMGVVVAATHLQLDIPVALKTLLPEWMDNEEVVGRFEREAKAAARISSEHVVRVTDVGKLENGIPYIVMEFVEGMDLDRLLSVGGPLSVGVAVDYVLQACEAVAEAHVAGIVHRDIKPSNLFLAKKKDGSEVVKVFDFGISKIKKEFEQNAANITQTSISMGTPSYMAPEQMKSAADVDERCDIWSLGMVLHELVAGKPAFEAGSVAEIMAKVISSIPAPPLNRGTPNVPLELNQVVSRCLEKKPHNRYQNVMELVLALEPLAPPHARRSIERIRGVFASVGISVGSPSLPNDEATSDGLKASVPAMTPMMARRKRLARAVVAGVGVTALLIGVLSVRSLLADKSAAASSVGLAAPAMSAVSQATNTLAVDTAPTDEMLEVLPVDEDEAQPVGSSEAPTAPPRAAAPRKAVPTAKPAATKAKASTPKAPKAPAAEPLLTAPPVAANAADPFANPYGGRK